MKRRKLALEYDGKSIYRHVVEGTPNPGNRGDFLCYVMGPYTPFDVTYAYPADAIDIDDPYIEAELFDPDDHEDMEATLRGVCTELRRDPGTSIRRN